MAKEDISTLLDPRFKEVCFSNSSLVIANKLLICLMHKLNKVVLRAKMNILSTNE